MNPKFLMVALSVGIVAIHSAKGEWQSGAMHSSYAAYTLDPLMFDEPLRVELIRKQANSTAFVTPVLSLSMNNEHTRVTLKTSDLGIIDQMDENVPEISVSISINGAVTYTFLPQSNSRGHEAAMAIRDVSKIVSNQAFGTSEVDIVGMDLLNEFHQTVLLRTTLQPIPFVAAFAVSLIGTACLMLLTLGNTRETNRQQDSQTLIAAPAGMMKDQPQPEVNVEAILLQAKRILHDKKAATMPTSEKNQSESTEDIVEMARTFGRGQGEVRLAQAVEASNRQNAWQRKLQQLEEVAEMSEPIASAKKLGVGRGELDLAKSLRRLREDNTTKGSRND